MAPERLGRRSFLGGFPSAVLTGKREPRREHWPVNWETDHSAGGIPFLLELTRFVHPDGTRPATPVQREWVGDPFEALRRLQEEYGTGVPTDSDPEVFGGGLVGFFGYEVAQAIENLPDTGIVDPDLPDLAFMVVDAVACLDHRTQAATLTVTGRGASEEAAARHAQELTDTWLDLLANEPPLPAANPTTCGPLRGDFDLTSYSAAVERCRQHILAGDVFEVCLTQRLVAEGVDDPWALYTRLREINPAPFAAWLQFPGFQILSASPERFLKVGGDRLAESRPIKGTRPRGSTGEEDLQLKLDLAASEKDRAENLMIVDLVRNDLGKVAETGSVRVPELMAVETYATVFQLVSTVQARLRTDRDALDLVRACYPGGSMTGAPKIRAMEIIDSLETAQRGVFSGAIGYLGWNGIMDLSIVIRTIVCQDGRAHFGVGGAVTADSDPAAEYQETLDKARALAQALGSPLP